MSLVSLQSIGTAKPFPKSGVLLIAAVTKVPFDTQKSFWFGAPPNECVNPPGLFHDVAPPTPATMTWPSDAATAVGKLYAVLTWRVPTTFVVPPAFPRVIPVAVFVPTLRVTAVTASKRGDCTRLDAVTA